MRLLRLFLAIAAAGLAGCATTDKQKHDEVSSIPWNRPATWEGQGAFGSVLQGSR